MSVFTDQSLHPAVLSGLRSEEKYNPYDLAARQQSRRCKLARTTGSLAPLLSESMLSELSIGCLIVSNIVLRKRTLARSPE